MVFIPWANSAGTVTIAESQVKNWSNDLTGVVLTFTGTADSSAATYPPALMDFTTNDHASQSIRGMFLNTMITTPGYPAPTVNYDVYVIEGATLTSEHMVLTPNLAIGSTLPNVANDAFAFIVNNVVYEKAAVAAGTAPGNDVVPLGTYGAVAFDIGANGTIDAIEAADNATGYASAVLAIAGVPAAAADHARMGYVTASKSDGAFTFGTTNLNAANTTVAYTSTVAAYDLMGGRLVNRSATISEEVTPANTNGDDKSKMFTRKSWMVIPVGNSVNSAIFELKMFFSNER